MQFMNNDNNKIIMKFYCFLYIFNNQIIEFFMNVFLFLGGDSETDTIFI